MKPSISWYCFQLMCLPQRVHTLERVFVTSQLFVVQSLSRVWLFATQWTAAHKASLSFTISWSTAQVHVYGVCDAIQPSHPLSSPPPPAFSLSQNQSFPMSQLFTSGGQKYWCFRLSTNSFKEYSGLISFRIDWFDLLEVLGLSGVFSNTTVQKHQFFGAQLSLWSNSHISYITTKKTHSFD